MWDVFICHASEDKDAVARPLAEALRDAGLQVWYDEFTLTLGDGLRRSIDRGLADSKYGVVILSPSFFQKEWPQLELDGLASKEIAGEKVILPVWHNVTRMVIMDYSPTLTDKLAVSTKNGLGAVVQEILKVVSAPDVGLGDVIEHGSPDDRLVAPSTLAPSAEQISDEPSESVPPTTNGVDVPLLDFEVPYTMSTGLTVTVHTIVGLDQGGFNRYIVDFTGANNTPDQITDYHICTIYFADGSAGDGLIFPKKLPGQSDTRRESWDVLKSPAASYIEFTLRDAVSEGLEWSVPAIP